MESFLFCQVCGDEFYSGLHACKGCHERASAKKKTSPGIDELAKRNAELQDQLEQITARRADAIGTIEEQRETIYALKKRLEGAGDPNKTQIVPPPPK